MSSLFLSSIWRIERGRTAVRRWVSLHASSSALEKGNGEKGVPLFCREGDAPVMLCVFAGEDVPLSHDLSGKVYGRLWLTVEVELLDTDFVFFTLEVHGR